MFDKLRDEIAHYSTDPHLLSIGDDGRAHAVAVRISWDGDRLLISAGKSSLANVAARRLVSVLWVPSMAGGYSLIVDGEGVVRGSGNDAHIVVGITRAVLHRPGAPATPTGGACGSDCRPLFG
jgi:hypothetical protein